MEHRGQARDMLGIQDSPVKLIKRRGNATTVSIFSPTQILDHQNNHPSPHLRHQLNPPPGHKELTPDPDPPPTAAATSYGTSNSKAPATQPQPYLPPPPPPPLEAAVNSTNSIIYRECLKNHAAGIGGYIVDGCGEYMATGEEGTTPEALRCAACDCHRNFHRKQVKGSNNIHRPNPLIHKLNTQRGGHQQNDQKHSTPAAESSSEYLNMPSISGSKKRHRTKFSQQQKDRMHEFAEKMEWRIQKQYDQEIQRFCSEVGLKRQVFKVWMHNNKQAMKKRN